MATRINGPWRFRNRVFGGAGSRLQQHDCDQKCELSNWVILLNVVTTRSAPCLSLIHI